jgi:ArsR family transcriptional regulator
MLNLVEFFKLVSDETRLRIVILLSQENLFVCQICGILNLSQPKVSKHLSKLRDLNYVVDVRNEKYIMYSLNLKDDVVIAMVQDILKNIEKYPLLIEDRKKLSDKSNYLNQCSIEN